MPGSGCKPLWTCCRAPCQLTSCSAGDTFSLTSSGSDLSSHFMSCRMSARIFLHSSGWGGAHRCSHPLHTGRCIFSQGSVPHKALCQQTTLAANGMHAHTHCPAWHSAVWLGRPQTHMYVSRMRFSFMMLSWWITTAAARSGCSLQSSACCPLACACSASFLATLHKQHQFAWTESMA